MQKDKQKDENGKNNKNNKNNKSEKPTYNIWQNSAYVLKGAWDNDKIVLWVIIAQVILAVTISTVGIFLPATVVEQITSDVPVSTLVSTILLFTAALVLMQGASGYFNASCQIRRSGLRLNVGLDLIKKAMTTDYANLEEKSFTDANQKAYDQIMGNATTTEQIYFTFTELGTNVLGFVVYIILLAAINPLVLLITAATTVFGVLARIWANKWQYNHDTELAGPHKRIWYISHLGVNYSMAKDIRLFAMTNWIKDVYDANSKLAFNFHRKINIRQFVADGTNAVATFAREGIAYAYLIWAVLAGDMTVDGFVLMFAAVGGFSTWIAGMLSEYSNLNLHSLNYCRVREFLEYPDKFTGTEDIPTANPSHSSSQQSAHPSFGKYSLELRNVTYRYSGAEENTLENVNLIIKPGEKLAIVGLNGAGKTTIVKLLCGLYDPTEGAVLINGIDIRVYDRLQYYKLITGVFQEFSILAVSIAENISQTFIEDSDWERINRSLELAGLSDKINSLPEGASSFLIKGANIDAVELSGGETQRLMLARALYKDGPILVLDEPTAALDPIAESELYERYNELSLGRTSIYISHRLASTRFCDRIILVADKGIAEMGTHDELMTLNGKYAELFEIQSKYYKEGVE